MKTFVTLFLSSLFLFIYGHSYVLANDLIQNQKKEQNPQDRINADNNLNIIDNESYTTRFIAGHKTSLILGTTLNNWYIRDNNNDNEIQSVNLEGNILFDYQFHINLLGKVGMFFGTKTGLSYDLVKTGDIDSNLGIYLPSVVFGIVDNHKTGQRVFATIEYSAIYYYKLKIGEPPYSSDIPNAVSLYLGYEKFFKQSLSYSLLLGYRYLNNNPVFIKWLGNFSNKEDQTYHIKQHSLFFQVGLNWQLMK